MIFFRRTPLAHLRAFAAGLAALALALASAAGPALAQSDGAVINLRNADINVFIDDVSAITGYTFIPSPQVRGNVTVVSQYPMSPEVVFDVFQATLRAHGFAVVRLDAGVYRIVPEDQAAGDQGAGGAAPGDQFSTVVVRLTHADAEEAAQTLNPILGPQGTVSANPEANAVVIVDYVSNLRRLQNVLTEMDRDRSDILSVPVVNMSAREMAEVLMNLYPNPSGNFAAVPVRAGNSVVLRGDADTVARMAGLIGDLDRTSLRQDSVRVVKLQNADAEEIVPVLENVAYTLARQAGGEAEVQDGEPRITHYAASNSLVISAAPETLNEMERVIAELDVRRPQVLVEAIIVEVSDTAAQALGLQFLFAGDEGFFATPYANTAPNIAALAGALINDDFDSDDPSVFGEAAAGSLLAMDGFVGGAGGQNADGEIFGAILNAVANDQDSNVLSTPSVTTLDNQEAYISVGQEIPISTGEVLSSSNNNPFRTIDRKKVGVMLQVRPQIGEGDTIKLYLRQEASQVIGPVNVVSGELITSVREIETTALADDRQVIVLGGLIQEDDQQDVSKVPLLGDIPLVGNAFKSSTKSRVRTNLMVFIRPTILRDAGSAAAATATRMDYMRGQQFDAMAGAGRADEQISLDRVFRDAMGGAVAPLPAAAPDAP